MQTKLTKIEKADVRKMIENFKNEGGILRYFPKYGLTIAMSRAFPGSRGVMVGLAQASPTETKFRKLVGAMYAIERSKAGAGVALSVAVNPGNEESFAGDLAFALNAGSSFKN